MVASQDSNFWGVLDFEGKQEAIGLDALSSSINIVPKEKIGRLWRKPTVFEQSEHVVVLSVYIPTNFDGGGDFYKHGLFHEYGFGGFDEAEYLLFCDFDHFSRFSSAHIKQSLDDLINIDFYFFIHFTNKIWICINCNERIRELLYLKNLG